MAYRGIFDRSGLVLYTLAIGSLLLSGLMVSERSGLQPGLFASFTVSTQLHCYYFFTAFGLPGFSSGVTNPIGRFLTLFAGGSINSRIASNTCFNCARVLCASGAGPARSDDAFPRHRARPSQHQAIPSVRAITRCDALSFPAVIAHYSWVLLLYVTFLVCCLCGGFHAMPEYECIDKPDGGVLVFLLTLCQGLESLQQAHIADRHRIGDCAHQQIIGGGNKHFCQLPHQVSSLKILMIATGWRVRLLWIVAVFCVCRGECLRNSDALPYPGKLPGQIASLRFVGSSGLGSSYLLKAFCHFS